jgi:hypothetical protein
MVTMTRVMNADSKKFEKGADLNGGFKFEVQQLMVA